MVSNWTGSHVGRDGREGAGLSVLVVAVGCICVAAGAARATCPTIACTSNSQCNDGQFCTVDYCLGGHCNCVLDDSQCQDALFCNGAESCNPNVGTTGGQPGSCQPGSPVTCQKTCSGGTRYNLTCTANTDCPPGPPFAPCIGFCSEAANACVQCLQNSDCTASPRLRCDTSLSSPTKGTCVQCLSDFDCKDGLFCNGQESCNASTGLCQAGTPPDCTKKCFRGTSPGATCTTDAGCGAGGKCLGYCSEVRDACVQCDHDGSYASGGCDDGTFCNGAEACQNDQCVAGAPPVCKKCVGGSENGQPCSTNPDCPGSPPGTCTGGPSYCDEVSDRCVQCLNASQCEDLNFCTSNVCLFNSCVFVQSPAICGDGLFCNGEEVCNYQLGNPCSISGDRAHCCFKGTCSTSSPPKGCNSNTDCPSGTGTCDNPTATSCNADHSACTKDCNDDIACTVDSCNETIDSCQHVASDSRCGSCHPGIPRCVEGTNHGQLCVNSTQCPGGTCALCVTDSDCPGVGQQCRRTSFGKECLPSATCVSDSDCLVCVGGNNPGTPCTSNADCPGGGTCPTGPTGQKCWSPSIPNRGNLLCDGNEKCTPDDPSADPQTGCVAGTAFDCHSSDSDCSEGTCLEQPTVHCQSQAINPGARCDDHNQCTALSKCSNGSCVDDPPTTNDPYRCVKLEWRPATVPPVLAGSTVELSLYAVANGCSTSHPSDKRCANPAAAGNMCTSDSDCRVCVGGAAAGHTCTFDSNCRVCVGGSNPGA